MSFHLQERTLLLGLNLEVEHRDSPVYTHLAALAVMPNNFPKRLCEFPHSPAASESSHCHTCFNDHAVLSVILILALWVGV